MQAAVFHKPFDVRVENIKTPKPKEGEVLIRMKAASVCGTDVHMYRGKVDIVAPLVLGHDGSGVIEKVGKGVSGFERGDRVIPSIVFSCQRCAFCRGGKRNLCKKAAYIGFETNGTFAEYLVAPVRCIFKIPRNVSFEEAAVVEPIELALHTVELLKPKKGETVAVIGQGPIGLMATQVATSAGARVIAVDTNKKKLALAKKFGAAFVIDTSRKDVRKEVLKLTNGGADCAIEAVGSQPTIDLAARVTKPLGKIALVGEGKNLRGPLLKHILEQTIVTPVSGSGWEYRRALRLLSAGKVDVKSLVTDVVKLGELPGVLRRIADGAMKPVKVLVRMY
jgi:threonine dehydrogenase-like Zn-dependent dehydrogenase